MKCVDVRGDASVRGEARAGAGDWRERVVRGAGRLPAALLPLSWPAAV